MINQKFARYAARANSEFDVLPNLRIGENLQFTYRSIQGLQGEDGGAGVSDDENDYLGSLLRMAEATVVDFCGQSFSDAPEPVRLAILLFAGHHYAHRENGDPSAYDAMTAAFRALPPR